MLIIDTNVLFAFFHPKSSSVKEIFKSLKDKKVKLFVPQYMFEELLNIKQKVLKNCGLNNEQFSIILALLLKFVEIIPKSEYKSKKLSPHLKDAPLFALSLFLDKAPIWSREPRLKKQDSVDVLDDKDVKKFFDIEE